MAEFPALPLFTDAIIADCAHLSDTEFGLYLRILMLMWRSPECRIPHDEAWIGRKLQRDYAMALPLLNEFCQTDGNWWTQKRLLKEFAYVRKTSKRQSDAAKARWNKDKPSSHGNAAWHTSGNALTPTPTPKVKEKDKSFSKKIRFDTSVNQLKGITKEQLKGWEDTYPGLDLNHELLAMEQWLIANPSKRKKQYERFINNWLKGAHDKLGGRKVTRGPGGELFV
jgi:uncharacterized protein YdaU (DUF1376 family)